MINKTQLNKFRTIIDKNKSYLDSITTIKADDTKKYSMSVSMAVLMEYFSLNQLEAWNSITDSGDDNKIDAFYYSDDDNELAELVIIQSKYKNTDGDTGTLSEDEINLCIKNCKKILKGEDFEKCNELLKEKILRYRQLLKDCGNPGVEIKLFFATNGIIHEEFRNLKEIKDCKDYSITPIFVDASSFGHSSKVEFGELIVNLKDISDKTDSVFSIDDNDFSGAVVSCSVGNLMRFYQNTGERQLLSSNVRYLIKSSTVNKKIRESFINDPDKFCFLNNGVTILSSNFKPLPTFNNFTKIELTSPNIVNGGQTIATLYSIFLSESDKYQQHFEKAKILIRIYRSPSDYAIKIAQATNTQNPINMVDLRSNDPAQETVKKYLEKEGVGLLIKAGEDITNYDDTITNEHILQVYASLYADDPAKAKSSKAAIFKLYYEQVFNKQIDESACKKLYRCYQISSFINQKRSDNALVIDHAFYSLIYSMKKFNSQVLNEIIPNCSIDIIFTESFQLSFSLIESIIGKKQAELQSKFSMNNLFKGSDIKILIDLHFENIQMLEKSQETGS